MYQFKLFKIMSLAVKVHEKVTSAVLFCGNQNYWFNGRRWNHLEKWKNYLLCFVVNSGITYHQWVGLSSGEKL